MEHNAAVADANLFVERELFVELGPRFLVVLRQALPHALQGVSRHGRVRGDGTNGRASNPQDDLNLARPHRFKMPPPETRVPFSPRVRPSA